LVKEDIKYMKKQIVKQKQIIKKLKNIIRMYAPYMEFPKE
jgi:hypothetical protein